jgi:hypothetical protein
MSSSTHSNDNPDIHLVEGELRDGLATSRKIVQQSRYLIELSETAGAHSDDEGDCAAAS